MAKKATEKWNKKHKSSFGARFRRNRAAKKARKASGAAQLDDDVKMSDIVHETNLLMTKVFEGSNFKVGAPGMPRDLKSLMQLGLSPSKLAEIESKTKDEITPDDFIQLYLLANLQPENQMTVDDFIQVADN